MALGTSVNSHSKSVTSTGTEGVYMYVIKFVIGCGDQSSVVAGAFRALSSGGVGRVAAVKRFTVPVMVGCLWMSEH
jgi:hypothetical protein